MENYIFFLGILFFSLIILAFFLLFHVNSEIIDSSDNETERTSSCSLEKRVPKDSSLRLNVSSSSSETSMSASFMNSALHTSFLTTRSLRSLLSLIFGVLLEPKTVMNKYKLHKLTLNGFLTGTFR